MHASHDYPPRVLCPSAPGLIFCMHASHAADRISLELHTLTFSFQHLTDTVAVRNRLRISCLSVLIFSAICLERSLLCLPRLFSSSVPFVLSDLCSVYPACFFFFLHTLNSFFDAHVSHEPALFLPCIQCLFTLHHICLHHHSLVIAFLATEFSPKQIHLWAL
jgi:hypothetical protein